MRSGALAGLSIGYRAVAARRRGSVRELAALDPVEVNLVAATMQPAARVHLVTEHGTVCAPDMVPDPRRPRAD
ncbi:hypothetical protein [Sphingomonas glacialis]|uniref:hypothetical protein n=1 Tax=Sphingomonas glacialis TaxID=658225 RepID=UPI00322032B5